MPANLSMALGSASLSPLSMARAYAVFANGGYLVTPQFMRTITDSFGNVVFETLPSVICENCEEEAETEPEIQVVEKAEPQSRPLDISSGEKKLDDDAFFGKCLQKGGRYGCTPGVGSFHMR